MDGTFHISHHENLATHPMLRYLAGWVSNQAQHSPRISMESQRTRGKEVLYVVSGMGRVEIGGIYPDVRPGTVIEVDRNTQYRFQPSPNEEIDVRRVK